MELETEYLKKPIWALFLSQMLDMECAPAVIIIASNAAHHGNVVFRSMYCKLLFDVLCDLNVFGLIYFSACLFNLKESERSKGLNRVAFAWIPIYDDALTPDRPSEGLEGLKYSHQEYEYQCLSLVFKDWDQRTA